MFGNIGGSELFLILLIVLIFFGPKKLPDLAKGLGQGIREFRKAARDVQDELDKETRILNEPAPKKDTPDHTQTPGPTA
jgi:sec-independent protein translocase protein TatA